MKKAFQLALVCLALAAAVVPASISVAPQASERGALLADQNPVLPPPLPRPPPPPTLA